MTSHPHDSGNSIAEDMQPGTRALFGWSPPRLPADSRTKRWVDQLLPATGAPLIAYFGTVLALVALSALLPTRPGLIVVAAAAIGGSLWCTANFWRCRHAHCLVTGVGWLALSGFAFVEAILGRSLIGRVEPVGFFAVFVASLIFERYWVSRRGGNAVVRCL